MKLIMVGTGAFAKKHLDGLARIKGAEVVSIVGRVPETTQAVADKYKIPHTTTKLSEALAQPGVALDEMVAGPGDGCAQHP